MAGERGREGECVDPEEREGLDPDPLLGPHEQVRVIQGAAVEGAHVPN
jgi:hypothetical protein